MRSPVTNSVAVTTGESMAAFILLFECNLTHQITCKPL
jgi:hypothetical protein